MAAAPSPPHRSRHPELRHSVTRDCRVLSPRPTSLSASAAPPAASPRSAGLLWRSPHEQRFGPSARTHPPVGRPRPPPSSPRGEALKSPRGGTACVTDRGCERQCGPPRLPPRPAPLRILFSPYALGNAYGEKRDRGGGHRCYSRSIRDTHAAPRKTTRRSPVLSPPPPTTTTPRCHLAASPMSRRTQQIPPLPPCRDSAPGTCRAACPPRPRPAVSYRGCGERDARFSLPGEALRCRRSPGARGLRGCGAGGAAGRGRQEPGWHRDGAGMEGASLPPSSPSAPPHPPAACVYLKFEFYLRNMSWNADMEGGRARTRPALRGDSADTPHAQPASPPRTHRARTPRPPPRSRR